MATKTVTVKKGDTLSAIAKASGTTISALAKASGIKDVNKISVGQKITVPTSTTTSSSSSSKSSSSSSSGSSSIAKTVSGGSNTNNLTTQQVKDIQTKAGITADGIIGKDTMAVLNKQSSTPTPVIKPTTISAPKSAPLFANPFEGGFWNNLVGGVKNLPEIATTVKNTTKNALNNFDASLQKGSAYDSSVLDTIAKNVVPGYSQATNQSFSQEGIDPNAYKPVDKLAEFNKKKVSSYSSNSSGLSSDGMTIESGSSMNADNTGTNPLDTTPEYTPIESSTETLKRTLEDGTEQTIVNQSAPLNSPTPIVNDYSNIMSKLNALNTGLKDSLSKAGTWSSSGSKGEFQNTQTVTYTTNAANLFSSPEEATKFYSTPEGKSTLPQGVNPNDIISKVQVVNNGLTEPKTTAEFLAYDKNIAKKETDLYNEQIANEFNWTQEQKDILLGKKDKDGNIIALGEVEKQKKEQDAFIDYYEEKIQNEKTSAREKAQYMIDKAKAEFESKDAETEINRQNAKASLTEFLAKIGALRTDGNSLLGIEKLEQAYQSQRQSLKSNFQLSEREIRMDMNDRINTLESDLDEKKFTLMQDLSKTEREVSADVAKLDYEYKKDMISIKSKYQDSIQSAKDKASAKAEKASSDWLNAYLTTTGADMFKSLPADFRDTWLQNNPINPQGFRTTQEDLAKDYANWSKNQPKKEANISGEDIKQMVNKQSITPEWKAASKQEKRDYILSLGGDPTDFGL